MALTIRLAALEDAEQIQRIYEPFCRDSPVSFETEAPTALEICARIDKTVKSLPWLVCEEGGQVLGYAYASPHRERAGYRWSVDVSVYIREGRRRAGLGRALYTALLAILKLQGFHNVLAGATMPNPASAGLHEAMGFQPVGVYRRIGYKCGAWHDVKWWQLILREGDAEPGEPLPLPAILESPEYEAALQSATLLLG
jgi:phosphinothricin acetyltransferase